MIQSFRGKGTVDIFGEKATRMALRTCPRVLWPIAIRKLEQLDAATRIGDLAVPPGNRLELLRGDRVGRFSIRINNQYRICFAWGHHGPEEVEIVDYHR